MRAVSAEKIRSAVGAIHPEFANTPHLELDSLNERLGCRVVLKIETLNPIRSFKGRGASLFVSELPSGACRLVCASAGNFGQGMAYAARDADVSLDVFAATGASPLNLQRIRELGATVHRHGNDLDAAKAGAKEWAATAGVCFVEDGAEAAITLGAGTIAAELPVRDLDAFVVPLGNGALAGGVGVWCASTSPGTRVVGACAAGAPSMALSWQQHAPVATASVSTIADGVAVRVPVPAAVKLLDSVMNDAVLVDDSQIIAAMRLLLLHVGIAVEPSGAVGVAAILQHPDSFAGRTVATVLTGANLAADDAKRWLWP